jgi:hypothetical protein
MGSERPRHSPKATAPERVASNFTNPSTATIEPNGATPSKDESLEELLWAEERKELSCSDGNETAPEEHPNEQDLLMTEPKPLIKKSHP